MANERLFRIEWNDDWWTESVSSGHEQIHGNDLSRPALDSENGVPDYMPHVDETSNSDIASRAILHSGPVTDGWEQLDSPVIESMAKTVVRDDGEVKKGEVYGNTISDVQRPVNINNIRKPGVYSNQSTRGGNYGSVADVFMSEGNTAGNRENSWETLQQTVRRTVEEKLSELKVYVLESDITEAQEAVKAVVKQASF